MEKFMDCCKQLNEINSIGCNKSDIDVYRHNQMKEELINNLDVALDRLRKIWDEIGIVGEQRKDRTHVI